VDRRIAIVIERGDILLGGAERSVLELSAAISQLGFEPEILAAKGQAKRKNIQVLCPHRPGKRTCYFTFRKALRRHLSENHYGLIHSVLPFEFADVYQPRGGAYAESIARNAASYENKLLESYKKLTAFANYRRTILLRAERNLCRQQSGPTIVALSQYVAGQFKQHYGIGDERLVVIPNGIKADKAIDHAEADKLRSQMFALPQLSKAEDPALFLFVANNFRLKGLAPLIRAMQIAASTRTARPGYLIVAGRGKPNKYRHLAKKLNVQDRIIFLGPVRQIQNLLAIVDVAILPTFYDPASRFILEALAANKPVITTKFNGASEQFTHDRHGRIIDSPGNTTQLAEAICYFTDTNNIRKASQAISEDNIKEKISISRVAKELASLYESLLQKKRNIYGQ
jgi:UDP-glucose:(heptosyl)LPS alpha-1,3-glucosyltransferase